MVAKRRRTLFHRAAKRRLLLLVGPWRRTVTVGALVFLALVLVLLLKLAQIATS